MTRFRSVILDVDSTLSGIEGIDWLAARRGEAIAAECRALTTRAMAGEIPIEAVYGLRLAQVRPSEEEITALGEAYRRECAQGARELVRDLFAAGVAVHAVSGGLREGILPFARWLGLRDDVVHAVGIRFDAAGAYAGWEETSPLATTTGKPEIVASLALAKPVLAVGDGATDLAIRSIGATFAAFTGFVRREAVVQGADHVIQTFDELRTLVLS